MKKIIIAGIICILLLIACFSPWQGGNFGTFTIITGSGDNSRKALGWNDVYDSGELVHDILVIDSTGKEYPQKGIKGAQDVTFTVMSGSCKISVFAYLLEGEEESQNLQAVGSTTVNINPGKNRAVSVPMGEPNGEGYYKVTFEFDGIKINRYIFAEEGLTIPEYYYRNCKQPLAAGLYEGLFYDDKLTVNDEYVNWTNKNNGEPFIFINGIHKEITDNITITGEWKTPKLIIDWNGIEGNSIYRLRYAFNFQAGNYTLLIGEDITLDGDPICLVEGTKYILIGKETTKKIKKFSKDLSNIFIIADNQNLTLGKNITLVGSDGAPSPASGDDEGVISSIIKIIGGTLTMLDGSMITENKNPFYLDNCTGGGVYIGTGEFIMEGGTISNNMNNLGGGVYVGEGGTFTMKDGSIINNDANTDGGGVYVFDCGTFIMEGGTISDNSAVQGGGGVYTFGNFTIPKNSKKSTKAIISRNRAEGSYCSGGGVFVNTLGKFNMEDGEISGNWTKKEGGGVYLTKSDGLTKTGGIIYGYTGSDLNSLPSATENKARYMHDVTSGEPISSYGHAIYIKENNISLDNNQ